MTIPTPAYPRLFYKGLTLAFACLVIDQLSKWWILEHVMQPPRIIPVTPFFNLVMVWNRGISFGLFNSPDTGQWLMAGLALGLTAVLLVWLWRADRGLVVAGLGLAIGGAIGNVIDRVSLGAVADFLDFHWAGWHWPAFNVADSAIVVGAGLLILDSLFQKPENTSND